MKNNVSRIEERQFITKEFADTIAGKTPAPYLRLHDPVQKHLVEIAAGEHAGEIGDSTYYDRVIHFWREVSLAGMPRSGRAIDECYALLFESVFDLAEIEPDWALQCLTDNPDPKTAVKALTQLASHTQRCAITHLQLTKAFAGIYAPQRETDERFRNEFYTPFGGPPWFWAATLVAAGIDEKHELWAFRCALAHSSNNTWGDSNRLHIRLIREAPQRASKTPRDQLMAHPILRLARLKYREGSVEQAQVLRFLNAQCIKQGFESEEDYFGSDLTLAQWTRDAREWATNMLEAEPEACEELFCEAGEPAVHRTRMFYHHRLGPSPSDIDSLDATAALIKWAKRRRGFEFSQYRAQLWEFVVEIADAALWLGWLFPGQRGETACLQVES
jgi:hypothetical protein